MATVTNEQPKRWEVHDRYGNKIYMTRERWEHALESRPWLEPYLDEVLQTIRRGRRKQEELNPRKYRYYWPCKDLIPEYNHVVVVVLFNEAAKKNGSIVSNNYVVNVWAVFLYGKN